MVRTAGLRLAPLAVSLDDLLQVSLDEARAAVEAAAPTADLGGALLAPIESQEVWAAGVTYERSRDGRIEESTQGDVYERVYQAQRPEVFLKAPAHRVVADGALGGRPRRLALERPEPELGLVLNAAGEVFGYVPGNDVSSRSIEGENPLYLPQAKVYERSCALGPGIVPVWAAPELPFPIALRVAAWGTRSPSRVRPAPRASRAGSTDLAAWLMAALDFPVGAVLLTGTGIVPDESFSLQAGRSWSPSTSRESAPHQPRRAGRPGPRRHWTCPAGSAGVRVLRGAGNAGVIPEDGACVRLLVGAEALPGGGDEQRLQLRTAERAGRHVGDGQVHHEVEPPVAAVAVYRTAAPEGHPDAVLHVDGHAVGMPAARDLGEGAPPGEGAGRRVEVEAVDPTRGRVGIEHGVTGPVPLQPVRDGDAAERHLDAAIGVKPVQGPGSRSLGVGHGSAVEAALGIAAAVIHPDERVGENRRQSLLHREVGPQQDEPVLRGQHVTAAAAGPQGGRDRREFSGVRCGPRSSTSTTAPASMSTSSSRPLTESQNGPSP